MLETILKAGFRPRVIIVEYNANFEITEAKSILPPGDGKSWVRWDASTYQGMSLLAVQYLLNRFSYSLVFCNKVNCIGVEDSLLDSPARLQTEFFNRGRLDKHRCDMTVRGDCWPSYSPVVSGLERMTGARAVLTFAAEALISLHIL